MSSQDRKSFDPNLPLYQQVADELRRNIENGTYAVGSSLPTEAQLCTTFDISRHTARDALRLLEQAGYVSRRRGAGTYVESQRSKTRYVQSLENLNDLFRYAHDTRFAIDSVRRIKASEKLAAFLNTTPGTPWIKISGLRYPILSERPFAITEIYLDRKFDSILPLLDNYRGGIYALLEEHFPVHIARIGQDIQAETLTETDAAALDARPGTAALRVVRRYYDTDGNLMEVSSNIYPGPRFTYSTWIDRDERADPWAHKSDPV